MAKIMAKNSTGRLASRKRPQRIFIAAYAMKPNPMPVEIEKVSGMPSAVTTAGAASVMSFQSTSAMLCDMTQATNKMAGAVAKVGTLPANGAKNSASRKSPATTVAVNPVRPPALMPARLSM